MALQAKKIGCVILNWNNYPDTLACLDSLLKAKGNFSIYLVDNNSSDRSVTKILEWFDKNKLNCRVLEESEFLSYKPKSKDSRFFLIKNDENYGFAGGNNIGINFALNQLNDYIMLLNNDTLVHHNFLSQLVKKISSSAKIGSVQSLMLSIDGKSIDSTGQEMIGGKIQDIAHGKNFEKSIEGREIFGACAGAALFRSEVFKKIGLFDSAFHTSLEDVDLSWRARLAGYKSYVESSSIVYHKGGVSRKKGIRLDSTSSYVGSRNTLMIYLRYFPVSARYFLPSVYHLLICSSCALKQGKVEDLFSLLTHSFSLRLKINKNKNLKSVRKKWLK